MCLTPIAVTNKSGKYVSAPCGHCAECMEKFRQDWFIRLREHSKLYKEKSFITLTYDEKNLTYGVEPTLVVRDVQLFFKRLRKYIQPKKVQYYLVGEYGTKFKRPHYHAILFGLSPEDRNIIEISWKLGRISSDPVTDADINYVCKYHILRGSNPEGTAPSFSCCSKGLGENYIMANEEWHREQLIDRSFYWFNGYKKPLPRYFREKIYTKVEREALAAQAEVRYYDKMSKLTANEAKVNYFVNKAAQIEQKNRRFKRKSEESGSL